MSAVFLAPLLLSQLMAGEVRPSSESSFLRLLMPAAERSEEYEALGDVEGGKADAHAAEGCNSQTSCSACLKAVEEVGMKECYWCASEGMCVSDWQLATFAREVCAATLFSADECPPVMDSDSPNAFPRSTSLPSQPFEPIVSDLSSSAFPSTHLPPRSPSSRAGEVTPQTASPFDELFGEATESDCEQGVNCRSCLVLTGCSWCRSETKCRSVSDADHCEIQALSQCFVRPSSSLSSSSPSPSPPPSSSSSSSSAAALRVEPGAPCAPDDVCAAGLRCLPAGFQFGARTICQPDPLDQFTVPTPGPSLAPTMSQKQKRERTRAQEQQLEEERLRVEQELKLQLEAAEREQAAERQRAVEAAEQAREAEATQRAEAAREAAAAQQKQTDDKQTQKRAKGQARRAREQQQSEVWLELVLDEERDLFQKAPAEMSPLEPDSLAGFALLAGVNVQGHNDLGEYSDRSLEWCAARCRDNPECKSVDWKPHVNRCSLSSATFPKVPNPVGLLLLKEGMEAEVGQAGRLCGLRVGGVRCAEDLTCKEVTADTGIAGSIGWEACQRQTGVLADSTGHSDQWTRIDQVNVLGRNTEVLADTTLQECLRRCEAALWCVSVDWKPQDGGDACALSDATYPKLVHLEGGSLYIKKGADNQIALEGELCGARAGDVPCASDLTCQAAQDGWDTCQPPSASQLEPAGNSASPALGSYAIAGGSTTSLSSATLAMVEDPTTAFNFPSGLSFPAPPQSIPGI